MAATTAASKQSNFHPQQAKHMRTKKVYVSVIRYNYWFLVAVHLLLVYQSQYLFQRKHRVLKKIVKF